MAQHRVCRPQFRDDPLGQHLAQFHAPLVERIDPPDAALGEHLMFIQRNQRTQAVRGECLPQDQVGRPVALGHTMRRLVGR